MDNNERPEGLVTFREITKVFGFSKRQIEYMRLEHGMPHYKIGGRYWFRITEVSKYIEDHKRTETIATGA